MSSIQATPGGGHRTAVLPRALLLVVVAIVVGILGMHALGSSHAMAMHGASHSEAAGAVPVDATVGPTVVGSDDGPGHGTGTMMMLCGSMLASAGALLLALFAWRRPPRVWARLRSYALGAAPPTARIWGTGPPPVWEFSVIRC